MSRLTANCLLLLTAVIWGSSFVTQKLGSMHVGPLSFTGIRFLIGAAVVAPLGLRELQRDPGILLRHWKSFALIGTILFLGSAAQQIGVGETSVTNAGFLTGLYVPLVPILGMLTLRLKPHPVTWPGAALCLLGSWLLSVGDGELILRQGDLWVALSSIFWAAHVLLVGRMSSRTGMPTLVATMQFLIAGAMSSLLALGLEPVPFPREGLTEAWASIAYISVLSVGVGFTLQSIAQRFTHASDAAIILSGEGVFSAIAGAIVMGDRLNGSQWLGCALILGAILLVQLLPELKRLKPA